MRAHWIGTAFLFAAAAASAQDGRFFVTKLSDGYGLTHPEHALVPTASAVDVQNNNVNAYDYTHGGWVVAAFPPASAPSMYPGDLHPGEVVYLWGKFTSITVPPLGTKINGMEMGLKRNGVLVPTLDCSYYLCNDVGGVGFKRWDGTATPPDYPEFTDNNPQILVGVDAYGIKQRNASDSWNLHSGATGGRMFLVGAFVVPNAAGTYEYDPIVVNYSSGEGNHPWDSAFFTVVPEPAAGMALLLLALAAPRRR